MKTLALLVVLIIAGYFGYQYFYPENTGLVDSRFQYATNYSCAGGKTLRAEYADRLARVTLADGRVFTLEEVGTNAGAKYTNDGEQIIFLTKDYGASVQENGAMTHGDCVYQP